MKKIVFFLIVFIFAIWLTKHTTPFAGVVAGLVCSAVYTLFVEDFLDQVKAWLSIPIRTSRMTIFLYGRGGSGKTTLIKYLTTLERPRHTPSTENADYYQGASHYSPQMRKRVDKRYTVPIEIADYKGQAPTQALTLRKDFMNRVNAMIFIVDVVHPVPKSDGSIMSEEALVEWLSSDADTKINDRMIQHVSYVGESILSIIFSTIVSRNKKHLRSVRLVINKIDIIQKLMEKGYLRDVVSSGLSSEDYVRKKFQPIEDYLRQACTQNGIQDVSVSVVSLTKGTGVKDLVAGLLKTHLTAQRIR